MEFPNRAIRVLVLTWSCALKVRDANPAELAPKSKEPPPLSPRQLAIRKRELIIGKALRELADGGAADIKRVELDDGEKLPTIRAAIARQISGERSDVQVIVRNGALFLRRGALPPQKIAGRSTVRRS